MKNNKYIESFEKYWKNSFLREVDDINGEDYDSLRQFYEQTITKVQQDTKDKLIEKEIGT